MLDALAARLDNLVTIGLGYLSLDRESSTLSGGESQRVKMVRHLGSSLTDITYVFDEPSVGLHPHDVGRLAGLMQQLRDKGNTVLDRRAQARHDRHRRPRRRHGAARRHARAARSSTRAITRACSSPARSPATTSRSTSRSRTTPRKPDGKLKIKHAKLNNLKDVSVSIPRGVLTVVTGVAGVGQVVADPGLPAGRLSRHRHHRPEPGARLAPVEHRDLYRHPRQRPQGLRQGEQGRCRAVLGQLARAPAPTATGSASSTPTSPISIRWSPTARPARASASPTRCCSTSCAASRSRDVYEMSVADAAAFFTEPAIAKILQGLVDVGLGYLTLGQPLSTLSGGERQRLKLAAELGKSGNIYVLDEPTTGLHMNDVDTLIGLFDRLVDAGSTVIVIEHNLDVDLAAPTGSSTSGPGAGHDGGTVVFEGHPAALAKAKGR